MKIVSGGQTGADRAALDVALDLGCPCGGWCPAGRRADDGPIPARYPLEELPGAGYRQRTIRNVADSDGTAIFYVGRPIGGTELTLGQCIRQRKPYQLIDTSIAEPGAAAAMLIAFVGEFGIRSLNVAGPSERRAPGIHAFVYDALAGLLKSG